MNGCFYIFFIWPFYLMYYMIIAVIYIIEFTIKLFMYLFVFICKIISVIINQKSQVQKENNYINSNSNTTTNNKTNSNINNPPKSIINNAYILIQIEKTVDKQIFKDNSINEEAFGLKFYDCPFNYVNFDKKKYYEVEIDEESYKLAGKLLDAMFNKLKDKMLVKIGKNRENIKYKYYYTNEGVMINKMTKDKILQINSSIRNEYNRIYEGVSNRSVLEDNPDDVVNEIRSYNIDETDFSNLEDYLADNILIYEWFYLEQLLTVMAQISLTPKTKPLAFINTIEYVDNSTANDIVIKKKKTKNNSSWQDDSFAKEAKLWGLSKEDQRIAKQERMTPADYIEAEERNDDVLDTDE